MMVQKTYDGSITDVVPAERPITVRQLLTHTAGLGYNIVQKGPIAAAYTEQGLIPGQVSRLPLPGLGRATAVKGLDVFADRLAKMPLVLQPGSKWSYSVGLDLMGRVIEVASGMKFDEFLRTRIFEPTGMTSTWFTVPESEIGRLTTNYGIMNGSPLPMDPARASIFLDKPPFPFGGAGLVSSPRDYDRFLEMLLGYGVIDGRRVMSEKAVKLGTSDLLPETATTKGTWIEGQGFGAGGARKRRRLRLGRGCRYGRPGKLQGRPARQSDGRNTCRPKPTRSTTLFQRRCWKTLPSCRERRANPCCPSLARASTAPTMSAPIRERLSGYMNWKARLLALDGLMPSLDDHGRLAFGTLADAPENAELCFLGLDDGKACFAAVPPRGDAAPRMANPQLWSLMATLQPDDLALYGGARSLIDWHARHRFCAACGGETVLAKGGWQRDCTQCGASHFPRTDPVTIMLVEHEGRLMLGRGLGWPEGRFSALAGFVEPGESIEEAVAREVLEESGVQVRDVTYVARASPGRFRAS